MPHLFESLFANATILGNATLVKYLSKDIRSLYQGDLPTPTNHMVLESHRSLLRFESFQGFHTASHGYVRLRMG